MFSYDQDIRVSGIELWLDARRMKPFGFISHAHGDHLARHHKILCTPPTADFIRKRLKIREIETLDFNTPLQIDDSVITLHPAGHILGSAQIRIENGDGSFLYSGDVRSGPSRTVEAFQAVKADTLIIESTFGDQRYRMPSRCESEERLVSTCHNLLKQGCIPVVLAYTLGKSQEALKILSDAALPVAVDASILRYVPVYQKYGVSFNGYRPYRQNDAEGCVWLLPVQMRFRRNVRKRRDACLIYLSGWGMDRGTSRRLQVDEVIPMSDHADFKELLEIIEVVGAKRVYCTHGFPAFVETLRAKGVDAHYLGEGMSL